MDVEREDAVVPKIGEHLPAPEEDVGGGRGPVAVRGCAVFHRGGPDFRDGIEQGRVAEQGRQRQVPPHGRRQVPAQARRVPVVDEVRDHDHQRSLPALPLQVKKGLVEPALHEVGLHVVAGRDHPVELAPAATRRHPTQDPVREADQPRLVAMREGDVGQRQRRVEGRIEHRGAVRAVDHHPPAVDGEHDPLALVRLVVADGEPEPARGGPPVDRLVLVVGRVVAKPLELVVGADPARPAHAEQRHPVEPGVERIAADLRERRVDGELVAGRQGMLHLPQTEPARRPDEHPLERERAPLARQHRMADAAA